MPTTAPSPPLAGGRLAAVIAGGLIALLALTFAAAGAGLGWAGSKKDDAGYYTSKTVRLTTSTSAIATDDLDIDGVPGSLGKVRLDVSGRDGKALFAGVARTRDVDAYLRGSAHATMTDVDFSPFDPTYRTTPGAAQPSRPGAQGIWTASTEGTGARTLDWKVSDGHWSVVVMNADGSTGVDANVSAGASLPLLDDLELGAWIAAAILFALGGGLIAGGVRRGTIRRA
jgi:hypothetical protein